MKRARKAYLSRAECVSAMREKQQAPGKKHCDVLLLNLPMCISNVKSRTYSLGYAYLISYLRFRGIEPAFIELDSKPSDSERYYLKTDEEILSRISTLQPRIIGMNCHTGNRFNIFFWAQELKERLPNTKIILGGKHVTFEYEETLARVKAIDYIVLGEGEKPFYELASHILNGRGKLAEINGIAFRKGSTITVSSPTPDVPIFDSLPHPSLDLFNLESYTGFREGETKGMLLQINSGRGCVGRCKFCSAHAFTQLRWRQRSAKNLIEEIKQSLSEHPSLTSVFFAEASFTSNRKRVFEFCEEKQKRRLTFDWGAFSRTDAISEDMVKIMAASGCTYLSFGIESGSKAQLKRCGKKTSLQQIKKAIRLCKKHGITPWANFIIGMPGETYDDALQTLKLITELELDPENVLARFKTNLSPGTAWFEEFKKENPDWNWVEPPERFREMSDPDTYRNIIEPVVSFSDEEVMDLRAKYWTIILGYAVRRYPLSLLRIGSRITGRVVKAIATRKRAPREVS